MHPYLNTAFDAARKAGHVIVKALDRLDMLRVDEKSQHNYVTEIDKKSEQIIIDIISRAYPNHSFLGEETGEHKGDSGGCWIIDPLDGTNNFIHGFPHFAISIGYQENGKIEHGLVYDPVRNELFTATRGGGAYFNQTRIRVSQHKYLNGAFVCAGSPIGRARDRLKPYFQMIEAVYHEASGVRRTGSAALDLSYVACGRFDGFWEAGLSPWDVAAGSLLVTEAGGLISDYYGEPHSLDNGQIVAGNPKIFKAILQAIRPYIDL